MLVATQWSHHPGKRQARPIEAALTCRTRVGGHPGTGCPGWPVGTVSLARQERGNPGLERLVDATSRRGVRDGQLADETGASCCSPHTGRRRCRRALCGPAPPLARCRGRRPGGALLPPDESIAGHLERWSFSSLGGSARRGLPDLGTSGSRHLGALSGSDEEMQGSVREPFRLLGLPDATAIR